MSHLLGTHRDETVAAIAARARELDLIGADIDAYQDKVAVVAEAGIFDKADLGRRSSPTGSPPGAWPTSPRSRSSSTRNAPGVITRGAPASNPAEAGVASNPMASDMLCCPDGTDRLDHERTGSGPGAAVSTEQLVWGRAGSRSAT